MSIILLIAVTIITIGGLYECIRFDNLVRANRKVKARKDKNRKRFNIDIMWISK